MLKPKELLALWRRDDLLTQALNDSHRMLVRTNAMFRESVRSLRREENGELGIDIYEEDKQVNLFEQKVRRKVLKHLAITGHLNVGAGLILTSVVIDIERVGDYTKNIMELAVAHPRRLECGSFEEDVKRIEETVSDLFDRILPVLEASDETAARKLIDGAVWIKKRCDEIDRDLIQETDPDLRPGDAVSIALYVRYLKRIGSHLINILSSVINPFERIGYSAEETD